MPFWRKFGSKNAPYDSFEPRVPASLMIVNRLENHSQVTHVDHYLGRHVADNMDSSAAGLLVITVLAWCLSEGNPSSGFAPQESPLCLSEASLLVLLLFFFSSSSLFRLYWDYCNINLEVCWCSIVYQTDWWMWDKLNFIWFLKPDLFSSLKSYRIMRMTKLIMGTSSLCVLY